MSKKTTEDFKKGDRVRYVPSYFGEYCGEDCESGVVSSRNENFVFVKFDQDGKKMVHGDEGYTSMACLPGDLILEEDADFFMRL